MASPLFWIHSKNGSAHLRTNLGIGTPPSEGYTLHAKSNGSGLVALFENGNITQTGYFPTYTFKPVDDSQSMGISFRDMYDNARSYVVYDVPSNTTYMGTANDLWRGFSVRGNSTGSIGMYAADPLYARMGVKNDNSTGVTNGIQVENHVTGVPLAYTIEAWTQGYDDGERRGVRNYMTGGTGTRYGVLSEVQTDPSNTAPVHGVVSYIGYGSTSNYSYASYSEDNNTYGYAVAGQSQYGLAGAFGGNVLIGDNIYQPIASGHRLSVRGKIACEEVLVALTSAWPDYVFSDQYNLKSLKEVEAYIRNNKHLPNIPAASTLEESGLQLGDMQRKTIEKIEELTLYAIDADKRIETLQTENATVKEELSALRTENATLKEALKQVYERLDALESK
jgi:hypothetical protein